MPPAVPAQTPVGEGRRGFFMDLRVTVRSQNMTINEASPWPPSCSLDALRARARLLAQVRQFFAEREVLEVETPALGRHGVSDVHLAGIAAAVSATARSEGGRYWLQTSPEYHMKRLLAAGSGPIYQVSRVFRDGERGRRHNPEFSMLEWYRPGFDHLELMAEVAELVHQVTGIGGIEQVSYRDAVSAACRS